MASAKLCSVIVFQTGGGRLGEVGGREEEGALLFQACCQRGMPKIGNVDNSQE